MSGKETERFEKKIFGKIHTIYNVHHIQGVLSKCAFESPFRNSVRKNETKRKKTEDFFVLFCDKVRCLRNFRERLELLNT